MFEGMRSRLMAVSLLIVALGLVGVGCGSDDDSGSDAGRVGYITTTGVEFFECFANGVKAEVQDAGNEYVQATVEYDNPGSEVDAAEDLITQQVDVVVYLSVNPKAGPGVVQSLQDEDVAVVTVNDDSFLTEEQRAALAGRYVYDLPQLGEAAADTIVPDGAEGAIELPQGTQIAAVEPAPGQGIGGIYDGFTARVEDAGYEFLGRVPAKSYSARDVAAATDDLLTSYPDVDVIFTDDTDPATAIETAIDSAGSDAELVAVGGRDEDRERLGKGLLGYGAVTAYADGARAGEIANAVVAGDDPPYQNQDAVAIPATKATVDDIPPYCDAAT